LPHYLVKFKCSIVQRFIHTCMLHSVLAGLICTSLNENPDNSSYFCSKRFTVSLFILLSTTKW